MLLKENDQILPSFSEIKIINEGCITNNLINIFMDFSVFVYN